MRARECTLPGSHQLVVSTNEWKLLNDSKVAHVDVTPVDISRDHGVSNTTGKGMDWPTPNTARLPHPPVVLPGQAPESAGQYSAVMRMKDRHAETGTVGRISPEGNNPFGICRMVKRGPAVSGTRRCLFPEPGPANLPYQAGVVRRDGVVAKA